MQLFLIPNFMNEKVEILEESYYNAENLNIVAEAKMKNKNYIDGEIRSCHFPMFPKDHQDRPGLIIHRNGVGPLIMVLGSTKDDGTWKNYKANVLVRDWKQEGLHKETYANTKGLYKPDEIQIYGRIGSLTDGDYKRIIEPTVKRINRSNIESMFESVDYEYIFDLID